MTIAMQLCRSPYNALRKAQDLAVEVIGESGRVTYVFADGSRLEAVYPADRRKDLEAYVAALYESSETVIDGETLEQWISRRDDLEACAELLELRGKQ